ncbi:CDP-glycerol glycerophosphotransferase family protein [Arthrobacter rhombi]|uniref:CDP-glycerol glycerophosphotransferase family protein n=1 Tax=Arthrobacter rhombi TaxID=71253 RepID=UPI003FD0FF12
MKQLSVANLRLLRGRLLARMGKWAEAERYFKLAVDSFRAPTTLYLLGNSQFHGGKFEEALQNTEEALELDASRPDWLIRLGALYERAGRHQEAADTYLRALEASPENPEWQKRFQRSAAKAGSYSSRSSSGSTETAMVERTTGRQAVGGLSAAAQSAVAANVPLARLHVLQHEASCAPDNAVLQFQLGLAQQATEQEQEAAVSLACARALDPNDVGLVFHHAWALRLAGHAALAAETLDEAIRHSPNPLFASIGAGAYFQKVGLWKQAATLYEERLAVASPLSDLDYRAGLAREREYNWIAAGQHYGRALMAEPATAARHLRLGLTRERSGDLLGAVDSYQAALRLDSVTAPKWRYRLGTCLVSAGRVSEALTVFRGLHPDDVSQIWVDADLSEAPQHEATLLRPTLEPILRSHDVKILAARGILFMEHGMTRDALRAFEAVVRQDASQKGLNHFRLAMARLTLGDEAGAVEAFLDVPTFRRPLDIGKHGYFDKKWQHEAMEYVEYLDAYPMDEDLVLFESYHGSKIDCNPAAIYRGLRGDPTYDHLRFGWVVTGTCRVPEDVADDPRVSLIRRGSRLYRRCLGTAKYLVSNVSFPQYFVRRQGQKYLNTWHGTPLKSMGKDITSGFMQHANVGRNLLHTTHLLAPNQHTQDSLIDRYEVTGLFSGKVARLGSPRIDRMIHADFEDRARLLARLGIDDDGRQIVFYAPTWRGATGEKYFDKERLVNDLQALAALDAHVLFRAHHLAERALGALALEDITVVPADIDTYDALAVTDVLVTDYSSIFFDFLGAKKPIVFYAYDLEEYVAERGLYFDLADMPGEVAHCIEELTATVDRAIHQGIIDRPGHDLARKAFAPCEDGQATQRAIDFFFADSDAHKVELPPDDAPAVLYRHDFEPGADTEALLIDTAQLTAAGQRVAVLFDRSALIDHPERLELLSRLPDSVQRIVRAGPHVASVEERWNINQFNRSHRFSGQEQERIYRRAYTRDFHRATGRTTFSAVVQVSDLDPVGVSLLGATTQEALRRILVSRATTAAAIPTHLNSAAPVTWYDAVVASVEEAIHKPEEE